jgi:hypothetical protein
MNELVQRLAEGDHPVTTTYSVEELKQRIDIGYVHIKFTDTQGGTELGVSVDREATNISGADFEQGTGMLHLEGTLTLNFVRVRCIADIDLTTLSGTGHLEVLEEISP